jgi:hypothetical protein
MEGTDRVSPTVSISATLIERMAIGIALKLEIRISNIVLFSRCEPQTMTKFSKSK